MILGTGPTNRSLRALASNLRLAWRVVRRERPDAILSTGAGLAVPFFLVGKLSAPGWSTSRASPAPTASRSAGGSSIRSPTPSSSSGPTPAAASGARFAGQAAVIFATVGSHPTYRFERFLAGARVRCPAASSSSSTAPAGHRQRDPRRALDDLRRDRRVHGAGRRTWSATPAWARSSAPPAPATYRSSSRASSASARRSTTTRSNSPAAWPSDGRLIVVENARRAGGRGRIRPAARRRCGSRRGRGPDRRGARGAERERLSSSRVQSATSSSR